MKIRPYHRNDMDACLAIFDSNLPTYFALAERPEFEAFLRDLAEAHAYQVIELDGSTVACGGLSPPVNGRAGFCWGMVERSRHRQGLGRHLARMRPQHAATDPCVERVALSTSQPTEGFYAALGFCVIQRVTDGHGPGIHAVHMEARLQ
ncbi:GNAT family N-acetyltransferase [Stenotrophomonas sp. NPDC077659]|uniref:GNAT family N-acetyltransferase n=1 Tax=Stenotrophomonas sp. NPDC077659 TaxID=3390694 RepID=UPI003D050894